LSSPWVKGSLKEHEIEPSAELETYLPEVRHTLEAETLVEAQRAFVLRINGSDHDVLLERDRTLQERQHECDPDSPAPPIGAHVDAVFDGEAIAGTRPEVAE
jgi:hypothetical protein